MHVQQYTIDVHYILGTGTYGKVVKGKHNHTKEKVAVKIFSPETLSAFENETYFLAKLREIAKHSQGIIELKSAFIFAGYGYIVLPRYQTDLLELILRGKLSLKKKKKYFVQICKAVQSLHDSDVAHLDIKPDNILIDENGKCVLCDFGNAHSTDLMRSPCGGTLGYSAPETLANGRMYDPKLADIWCLGILLYVMISGYFPRSPSQDKRDCSVKLNTAKGSFCFWSFDLVSKILQQNPKKRISIRSILQHPWCQPKPKSKKNKKMIAQSLSLL